MKAMRAIKIDVVKKEVYEVEITANIQTIYKHLECECFCQVGKRMKGGDCLIVDDNGLLKETKIGWFQFGSYHQPLVGHGLIYGTDWMGETTDAQSDLEYIRSEVRFETPAVEPKPEIKVFGFDSLEDFREFMQQK